MEYLWWLKSDMQLKVIASNYNIYHVSRAIWERNYYAFEKLHITPETESPKENSDKLNNALKTMVLDSINKLRVKKKNAEDSNFDFLSKTVATNVDEVMLADFISQLRTLKVLVIRKTPKDYDSLYLSNVD